MGRSADSLRCVKRPVTLTAHDRNWHRAAGRHALPLDPATPRFGGLIRSKIERIQDCPRLSADLLLGGCVIQIHPWPSKVVVSSGVSKVPANNGGAHRPGVLVRANGETV